MTREQFEQLKLSNEQFYHMCEYIKEDIMNNVVNNNNSDGDIMTNEWAIFKKDVNDVLPNEISFYNKINMPSTMFELKTAKYERWSKYKESEEHIVEVWKYAWEGESNSKPGCLFTTKAKWWVQEFIQEDGSSIYNIFEVKTLKEHYERVKKNREFFRYIDIGPGYEPGWCMKLQWFDGRVFELERLVSSKENEIQMLIQRINKLQQTKLI